MLYQVLTTALVTCFVQCLVIDATDSQESKRRFFRSSSFETSSAHGNPVELLRFITPYGAGLDTFVDVTPYSQLLKDGSDLHFYSFIDTWVSNNTLSQKSYMDNVTKQCSLVNKSDGNGWLLSFDLVFTPAEHRDELSSSLAATLAEALHPRAVVPILSDVLTGRSFGPVAGHEAHLSENGDSKTVVLAEDDDDSKSRDAFVKVMQQANTAPVFDCTHGLSSFQDGVLQLQAARKLAHTRTEGQRAVKNLEAELLKFLLTPDLVNIQANISNGSLGDVAFMYNASELLAPVGLPVYFKAVLTDQFMEEDQIWWNMSVPFEPVGHVASAYRSGEIGIGVISFHTVCKPTAANGWKPELLIPRSHAALNKSNAFLGRIKHLASSNDATMQRYSSFATLDKHNSSTHLDAALPRSGLVGFLNLSSSPLDGGRYPLMLENGPALNRIETANDKPKKVCVIAQQIHGRIVNKDFELPELRLGERVIAQITSTGHGWESTQAECGEYCKVKYRLNFNNGPQTVEFMQWRDDCKANPTGKYQHGTWFESRNGWCPGAVNPGVFFDITEAVRGVAGTRHVFTLDTLVLSNVTKKFEPFTDWDGWVYGDHADLTMSLTLFVYPAAATSLMQQTGKQWHGCSRAEKALKSKSKEGVGALWPKDVPRPSSATRHLAGAKWPRKSTNFVRKAKRILSRRHHSLLSVAAEPHCLIDFEERSPWYIFNSSNATKVEEAALARNTRWVTVMAQRLVQGTSRKHTVKIDRKLIPSSWGQVGLRLRLERPGDGLEFDHWDRFGSVGILVTNRGAANDTRGDVNIDSNAGFDIEDPAGRGIQSTAMRRATVSQVLCFLLTAHLWLALSKL